MADLRDLRLVALPRRYDAPLSTFNRHYAEQSCSPRSSFPTLSWYFCASATSCSRTCTACASPRPTLQWHERAHMDTHAQTVKLACAHTCASPFHVLKVPHTQSQYIYLAQEVAHSCFTCLIVLLGHEMRQRKCVSVEEMQGRGRKKRREERRSRLIQGSISCLVAQQEASSISVIPPLFSDNDRSLHKRFLSVGCIDTQFKKKKSTCEGLRKGI